MIKCGLSKSCSSWYRGRRRRCAKAFRRLSSPTVQCDSYSLGSGSLCRIFMARRICNSRTPMALCLSARLSITLVYCVENSQTVINREAFSHRAETRLFHAMLGYPWLTLRVWISGSKSQNPKIAMSVCNVSSTNGCDHGVANVGLSSL